MTKTYWSSDSSDIADAIKEHPELPIYFNIPNDELAWDYPSTLHERHHVEICTLWKYGDNTFWDEYDLIDQIADDVYDEGMFDSSEDCNREARIRLDQLPSQDCILIYTSA